MRAKLIGQSPEYYKLYEILRKLERFTQLAPHVGWNTGPAGPSLPPEQQAALQFIQRVEADGGVTEAEACLISDIKALMDAGFWSKASAVWIPSGYAEDIFYAAKGGPVADLTFIRNGTRTRKGPSYVEQVPYNRWLSSEDFSSANWSKINGGEIITANAATAPNGTLTAGRVQTVNGSASTGLRQNVTVVSGNTYTISVWVKSATGSTQQFRLLGSGSFVSSDLDATTEWQRFTHTFTAGASATQAPIYGPSSNTGIDVYVWGAQFVNGSEARDYFRTTDRFNVPALDYTNDTCPALSLEPARTNLLIRSEEFDNANWSPSQAVITANVITGPDGLSTADKIEDNATLGQHRILQSVTVVSGTQYAFSVYGKTAGEGRYLSLAGFGLGGADEIPVFDLDNGTVDIPSTTTVFKSASIEEVLDEEGVSTGWYRCTVIAQAASTVGSPQISVNQSATDNSLAALSYTGDGSGFYIWGAQVELGSYATSYIPTTTATVSRIADSVSALTGVSDLIGQTEGTLYFEGSSFADGTNKRIFISDGTTNNRIGISFNSSNIIAFFIADAAVAQSNILNAGFTTGTIYKVAAVYRSNYAALFINGVKIGEDTSLTVPACTTIGFNGGSAADPFYGDVRNLSKSKTAISDAEAIALTTP